MKIFVAVSLLSGVLLFVGEPETILAENKTVSTDHLVWSRCQAYPACQRSCDRPYLLVCPRVCRWGNICEAGYVRQSNAENSPCILPADCPPNSRIHKTTPPPPVSDEEDDDRK